MRAGCGRGAIFNHTLVAPVGIAVMLAIAVLYAIFQRYWRTQTGASE
jgi:hypothetical protein